MKSEPKKTNTETNDRSKKSGYVWDARVISIAKKVGAIIRENEENEYRRAKISTG